jgi:DNA-binding CsgD family transcriptional regulator
LHARFETLSRREREVMSLVTAGMMNKQVGAYLGISEITIKAHRGAMTRKMGARSLADLVRMADALGDSLRQPPPGNVSSAPTRSAGAADRHSGYSPAPS